MTYNDLRFPSGRLRDVPVDECYELLASLPVGRISYCSEDGPVTLPVNHVVVDRDVLFRTSPNTDLGQHLLASPRVCYEVDDADDFFQSGWSVLVRGQAIVVEPGDLPVDTEGPNPWVEGEHTLVIRVRARSVTGRRIIG